VNHRTMKWTLLVLALLALMFAGACKKKAAPAAAPEVTTAPPPAPTQPEQPAAPATPPQTAKPAPAPQPAPEAQPTTPPPSNQTDAELFSQNVKDIYFDYDRYDLRPADQATITADAAFLKAHPSMKFTIEGHCDERGSTDYNLALGDNRANATRDALVKAGIEASRIRTVSQGKERPFCTESTESCYQQNRRAHFVFAQ